MCKNKSILVFLNLQQCAELQAAVLHFLQSSCSCIGLLARLLRRAQAGLIWGRGGAGEEEKAQRRPE